MRKIANGEDRQLLPDRRQNCKVYETQTLSSGAPGTLFSGRLKGSGNEGWRAIKKIYKKKVKDPKEFARRIEILQQMDHPNIIKLYEIFEDASNVYLVTE